MEDPSVWCQIHLAEVVHVIRDYQGRMSMRGTWYSEVDWTTVSAAFGYVLQSTADRGRDEIRAELVRVGAGLSDVNYQGLGALFSWPLTITPISLTDGGHRLCAMLEQGVESTPGMFHRDEVGESIDPSRVYPLRTD